MHVRIYVLIIYVGVYKSVCMYAYMYESCIYVCKSVYKSVYMYAYMYKSCIYMCARVYACTRICISVSVSRYLSV